MLFLLVLVVSRYPSILQKRKELEKRKERRKRKKGKEKGRKKKKKDKTTRKRGGFNRVVTYYSLQLVDIPMVIRKNIIFCDTV